MSYNYISRYTPSLVDSLMDAFLLPEKGGTDYGFLAMKSDILEEGNDYVIDVELPGFRKEDISVELNDGYLYVTAKANRSGKDGKKNSFIHRERFSGTATRSFYVGDVEEKDIKAAYESGVLTLRFPKNSVKKVAHQSIAID